MEEESLVDVQSFLESADDDDRRGVDEGRAVRDHTERQIRLGV